MGFCGQCGSKIDEGSDFCAKCGTPVARKQATPNPQQATPQPPAPDPQQAQAYAQQTYAQPNQSYAPPQGQPYAPQQGVANTQQFTIDMGRDYTSTFSPDDISDYKVFALVAYLLSPLGIVVTLLAAQKSPFAMFHAREATKLMVAQLLMWLIAFVLFFLVIPILLAFIGSFVLGIVNIICIFRAAKGQAKLAPIVGGMRLFR